MCKVRPPWWRWRWRLLAWGEQAFSKARAPRDAVTSLEGSRGGDVSCHIHKSATDLKMSGRHLRTSHHFRGPTVRGNLSAMGQ